VCLQLEHSLPRLKFRPLWCIDWRPTSGHNNKGKGQPEYRFKNIIGSHHHPFELNWNERTSSLRVGNLPIAVPLEDDPPDFHSLLAFAGEAFKITNLGTVRPPPWEEFLL
jgi:hypothetical protein